MSSESVQNLDFIKNQLSKNSMSDFQKTAKGLSDAKKLGASEAEKKRWKASLDFEAMFLSNMYKSMRQSTVSEGNELTEASPGREIFTEMLDNQYASLHSKSKIESSDQGLKNALNGVSNSMAAQIYRALTRNESGKDPAAFKNLPASTIPDLSKSNSQNRGNIPVTEAIPLTPEKLNPLISLAGKTFGVADSLIKSVIKAESANNPKAVSPAGAKGLMQLMDSTAQDMGIDNAFNPKDNIFAGTKYLKQLLNRFGGDEEKALAAYNAGPATVDKYGGVPPYAETQNYVKRVLKNKEAFEKANASLDKIAATEN